MPVNEQAKAYSTIGRMGLLMAIAILDARAGVVLPSTFGFFNCSFLSPNPCTDSQGQKAGSFSAAQIPPFGPDNLQGSVIYSTSPVVSYVVGGSGGSMLTDIDMT